MQTFHTWGTFPSQAMLRWDNTETRGMISVGTSKGYAEPEVISPQAIANGEGDNYPLNLNHAIATWDQPVYIRLMAEMNGHWNAYCSYNLNGTFRGPAHSPAAYRQAWRRFTLIVRGGPVAEINNRLRKLGMPPIQATVGEFLPKPKVSLLWVPHSSPTPNIHANRWQVYWPGKKYVDWVGTDIFSTAPNWANLNRLYEGYKHKPFVIGEYSPMGEDDSPYVSNLFNWSNRHKRSKMLVYYQGFGDDPTFNVSNFPGVRAVLRGRLAGPRFQEYATGAARRRPRRDPDADVRVRAARPEGRALAAASFRLAHVQHRVVEPVLLAQPRDALGLELEPVAGAELRELRGVELPAAEDRPELVEVMLEAARRDDLEDPAGLVAGVPERVPLVARLERQVPDLRDDDVVAEQGAHAALDHEAVLVLARVPVKRRRQGPRRHRMLHEREAPARLLGPGHHPRADRSQVDRLAVARPDDPRPLRGVESLQLGGP